MKRLKWSIASGMAALVLAAAAACADGTGGQPSASASAQPTAASPAATAASPAGTRSPEPPAAGRVTVTTSAPRYAVGDTLKVTVRNGRSEPVYTEDFQTECTIVTLQVSNAGSWNDITGCSLGRPTRTVKIAPGAADEILLDPHSFHLAEGQAVGFGAGTYRIRFGYRLGQEPMGAQPLTAYSATFVVR